MSINKSRRKTQAGVSLIGLMIGLFISMLCILASLTLYKTLIHVSTEARVDTFHDGQLAAALLTTQLEIQSAGYGLDGTGTGDVVETQASSGVLELLWRYYDVDNSVYRCRGLNELSVDISGMTYRVLKLVRVNSGCNENSALVDMTWVDVTRLGQWPVRENLAIYMSGRQSMLDVSITPAVVCSPYGAVKGSEHSLVTISAPSSSRINGGVSGAMTSFKYCLLGT